MSDLTKLLEDWPADPKNNVRIVTLENGREVVQLRVDQGAFQGVVQMNLDGRPDGLEPHGCKFSLDYHESRLAEHRAPPRAEGAFQLEHDDCRELFDESRRVYQRYIFLFQMQDYRRVVRDTERNMRLFRLVNRYAAQSEDREHLERWWPYILRVHAEARALQVAQRGKLDDALKIIETARERIRRLPDADFTEFKTERDRSFRALDDIEQKLRERLPPTPEEKLERELEKAVAKEAFEQAAVLRDELQRLRSSAEV